MCDCVCRTRNVCSGLVFSAMTMPGLDSKQLLGIPYWYTNGMKSKMERMSKHRSQEHKQHVTTELAKVE
ncbi:hypothetical protein J6590_038024 [Homalodisca vitripennis]|nr:hypothetical protein J6590_038024 [Homalodisca vitripennis]